MNFFKRLFAAKQPEQETAMNKYLIVGLGNPGAEYANTRHNIGFKVLDFFAQQESLNFETLRLGAVAAYRFKGRQIFLLKPNTFMNLSGKAVQYWMQKENIPLENILVITDDLNIEFGMIRIKGKGSDGGHNGLKSIQEVLGTQAYARFRFGISDAFKKGRQVDYVLGEWSDLEKEVLKERLEKSGQIIKAFASIGLARTMNEYNGK
ncbi:MAG TPA: aminoacyl-tRNA hydrolase [Flavobacterium sp.]|nr:aminoacyl-tRNA hydrolase [Flavobacterium sp.]